MVDLYGGSSWTPESTLEMPRHVWLWTRPLSYAAKIPQLEATSDGRPYLRHWGVLVTELGTIDAKVIFQTSNNANITAYIGTMYELMQNDERTDVFVNSEFSMQNARNDWRSFVAQYVGETLWTHERISEEGKYSLVVLNVDNKAATIISTRPTYRIIHNNCQNFATYLLEALCPGAAIPDTIEKVLKQISQLLEASQTAQLPGTYPLSSISTPTTYITASGTSWWTASGTEWVTAIEYPTSIAKGYQSSTIASFFRNENSRRKRSRPNPLTAIARFRSRRQLRNKLIKAINSNDLGAIVALLEKDVDLSLKDAAQYTALHYAIMEGNDEIVKVLIDAGADVRQTGPGGMTPLHCAFHEGTNANPQVVDHLLIAGASPSFLNDLGDTPLHIAMSNRTDDFMILQQSVRLLLQQDDSLVNFRNSYEQTPLEVGLSVAPWSPEKIYFLLESNADFHFRTRQNETAVHLLLGIVSRLLHLRDQTAYETWKETLKVFIKKGVDLSVQTDLHGATAIHYAVLSSDPEILECLLKGRNVDLSLPDDKGNTPLHTVFHKSSDLLTMDRRVKRLISSSADLSARNKAGRTPLLSACDNFRVPATVLEILIAAGADVNVSDRTGDNAVTLILKGIRRYGKSKRITFLPELEWSKLDVLVNAGLRGVDELSIYDYSDEWQEYLRQGRWIA